MSDADATETLRVDPETVVKGLEMNSRPGVSRSVVFRESAHGGRSIGGLMDTTGLVEGPLAFRPREFLPRDRDVGADPSVARRVAREEAADEADADPEEWADEAVEVWADRVRDALRDEIGQEQYGGMPVYEVEYVTEDDDE
jgi:hypothetical protein